MVEVGSATGKMGKIYSIKTGKKITNGSRLEFKEYSLKIIYECPNGHKFAEEYLSETINQVGMEKCIRDSIHRNEKAFCPDCDEVVEVGKRPKKEPK